MGVDPILTYTQVTSNDIIAGNGGILKAYMFIVWLYLLKIKQVLFNNFESTLQKAFGPIPVKINYKLKQGIRKLA